MTNPRTPFRNYSHGFTVIELMIAVVVLGVLIALAAPSLGSFIASNRLTGQANDLVGSLSLARSEAAARGRNVGVCAAASATSCAGSGTTGWENGYIVWADSDGGGDLDSTETIIKYTPALDGDVTLTASSTSGSLSYRAWGGLTGSTVWTFNLCAPGVSDGRQITLPLTGRAMVKKVTTC